MEPFVLAQGLMGESEVLTAVVRVAAFATFWRKPAPNPEDRWALERNSTPPALRAVCPHTGGRATGTLWFFSEYR